MWECYRVMLSKAFVPPTGSFWRGRGVIGVQILTFKLEVILLSTLIYRHDKLYSFRIPCLGVLGIRPLAHCPELPPDERQPRTRLVPVLLERFGFRDPDENQEYPGDDGQRHGHEFRQVIVDKIIAFIVETPTRQARIIQKELCEDAADHEKGKDQP